MIDVKEMLAIAIEKGASDVHIKTTKAPLMRINTNLVSMDLPVVSDENVEKMVLAVVGRERYEELKQKRDIDFSMMVDDGSRFRVNAHYQKDSMAVSFRLIPRSTPTLEELRLPEIIGRLTDLPRGLVLVVGHTGAGKSTTLASMINIINSKYNKRIITLEDPIEYLFEDDKSMIEQREIGLDCPDFAAGLRHVLRQDPDIVLVGEMRDLETTSSTITVAETGHLVFSTLHTLNSAQSVERIIDIYPASQQNQIRAMLANTLQAVISQTLFKRADKPGMVPCTEILLCTTAVRNCIRENKLYEIPNVIETSRRLGMHSMDYSIVEMYSKGFIAKTDAIGRSSDPGKMEKTLALRAKKEVIHKKERPSDR